jgi:hypothetical protein
VNRSSSSSGAICVSLVCIMGRASSRTLKNRSSPSRSAPWCAERCRTMSACRRRFRQSSAAPPDVAVVDVRMPPTPTGAHGPRARSPSGSRRSACSSSRRSWRRRMRSPSQQPAGGFGYLLKHGVLEIDDFLDAVRENRSAAWSHSSQSSPSLANGRRGRRAALHGSSGALTLRSSPAPSACNRSHQLSETRHIHAATRKEKLTDTNQDRAD